MPCTAPVPNLTAREQAQFIHEAIPPGLFRIDDESERIPWRVSPEPFALTAKHRRRDRRARPRPPRLLPGAQQSLQSQRARNGAGLHRRVSRSRQARADREAGAPESLQARIPGVIRPDLIITDDGFVATELDSVPGGMGFVGAMAEAYCRAGIESVGGIDGIPRGVRRDARACERQREPDASRSSSPTNRATTAAK